MKCALRQVGLTVFVTTLGLLSVGCQTKGPEQKSAPSSEVSLQEQIEAVASGKQDSIEIEATAIRDEQLNPISSLTTLRVLKLQRGAVSDAGLRSIGSLPKLEQIVLRDSPVTDEGAEILSGFAALRIVNLPQSHIGDEGIKKLSRIPNLELLRIGTDRAISADGLKSLCDAKNLRFVHLIGVALEDGALTPLGEIPALESLYIDGSQFSDEAISALLRRRPGLHLHLDQRHHDSDPQASKHSHSISK